MRDEDIVAAARIVRPMLPELIGDDASVPVSELDDLLRRAEADEPVADRLLILLTAHPAVRAELGRLLPEEADTVRGGSHGYTGLPGRGTPSTTLLYSCPSCDYDYPVFETGEPIPACPHGHGPLTPAVPRC